MTTTRQTIFKVVLIVFAILLVLGGFVSNFLRNAEGQIEWTFQRIVVVIAIVILAITLIVIGFLIHRGVKDTKYPPVIGECPDYWKVIDHDKCENVLHLGKCGDVKDFSGSKYQGESGIKEKAKWAKKCGLEWDGVTNNPIVTSPTIYNL